MLCVPVSPMANMKGTVPSEARSLLSSSRARGEGGPPEPGLRPWFHPRRSGRAWAPRPQRAAVPREKRPHGAARRTSLSTWALRWGLGTVRRPPWPSGEGGGGHDQASMLVGTTRWDAEGY